MKIADAIEARPGIGFREASRKTAGSPIVSVIRSLHAEHNDLQYAVPGGFLKVEFQEAGEYEGGFYVDTILLLFKKFGQHERIQRLSLFNRLLAEACHIT